MAHRTLNAHSMLIAIVIALIVGGSQAQDPSQQIARFEASCNEKTTSSDCQVLVETGAIFCHWDTSKCTLRSKSCPTDFGAKLLAIAQCGATANNTCPQSCIAPFKDLLVTACVRAGITSFTGTNAWAVQARTNDKVAQMLTEDLVCMLMRGGTNIETDCEKNLTNAEIDAAIAASMASAPKSAADAATPIAYTVSVMIAFALIGLAL